MRRLFIDKKIESIANQYAEEVKSKNKYDKNILHPDDFLKKAIEAIDNGNFKEIQKSRIFRPADISKFRRYLNLTLHLYNGSLLTMKPSKFARLKKVYDYILPSDRLNASIRINRKTKTFSKIIEDCLQYSLIRKNVIGKYIRKTGIKTCVYCNANYTITEKSGKAFMEIDHWKPQSKYPFLCISFFNLQPSCSYCNKAKSNDDGEFFRLYEENPNTDLDVFSFHLNPKDIALYRIFGNNESLNLEFKSKHISDNSVARHSNEVLHISKIYAEHKDIVEEIIRRKQYYNESFIESISTLFSENTYSPSAEDVTRFILGMYPNENDVLKRPLNKMMLDIFKESDIK